METRESPELSAYETYISVVAQNDGASVEQVAGKLETQAQSLRVESDIHNESTATRLDAMQVLTSDGFAHDEDIAEQEAVILEKTADGLRHTLNSAPVQLVHMSDAAGKAPLGGSQFFADPLSITTVSTGENIDSRFGLISEVMADGLDAHENEHLSQSSKIDSSLEWNIGAFHGDSEDALELGAGYTQREAKSDSIQLLSHEYQDRIRAVTIDATDRDDIRGGTEGIVKFVLQNGGEVDEKVASDSVRNIVQKVGEDLGKRKEAA